MDDGETDYVRVIDKMDKDVHALVLQVPVSETENQDIAVIEMEKTGDTTAILQIIGDEDIYGEEMIVEPDGGGEDEAFIDNNYYNSSLSGPNADFYSRCASPDSCECVVLAICTVYLCSNLQALGFALEMASLSGLVEAMEAACLAYLASTA